MTATSTQINQLLRHVAEAIIETVKETGSMGAPGGSLYAAMMTHGFSLSQFEQIMSGLVNAGMLTKRGQLYFVAGSSL